MISPFAGWAVVAHKDDTGFGRQAEDAISVLGVGHHIVIPSERLTDKPLDPATDRLLPRDASDEVLRAALEGVEGILFFERPGWHPRLLPAAREMGIKSVCIPNWEWFRGEDPLWKLVDRFACTHELVFGIVRRYGFTNTVRLPLPFDLTRFPARSISGPARLFVHNAGLVDMQDRKGTAEVIRAFRKVRDPELRLIVRLQKPAKLPATDGRIDLRIGNLDSPAALYAEGDVALQPSKMEGQGFMVIEPVACGIPTVTLDYPPMSDWVRQPELRVRKLPFKRRAFPAAWVKHAHLRLPSVGDLAKKIEWCARNDLAGISRANREWAEETFDPARVRAAWAEGVG